MSRGSTVTARRQPLSDIATASGALRVHGETITVETRERLEVIDLTDRVMALVHATGIREGLFVMASLHTTCTVFVNEFQPALAADIRTFLERLVDDDAAWRHNDPVHSDCGRANADAHLRALVLGHGLTLPVSGGEIVLGRWQRVLLAELDGPQPRTMRATVMGLA